MNKSTFFTGQPIFTQLLNFVPRHFVKQLSEKYQTDRYYKKFKTYDHLITMLYTCFHGCKSLREVTTGMQVALNKLTHLGVRYIPRRSTLSDANQVRQEQFFGKLYHRLYQYHYQHLPDSQKVKEIDKRLFIIDSTTIKLFSDIMKGMGSKPVNGKRKGGAKAHILMKADEDLPRFVCLTHAIKNDKVIMNQFHLEPGSIIVFDKAYNNYKQLQEWGKQHVTWVSRLRALTSYVVLEKRKVTDQQQLAGVIADEKILMGRASNKKTAKLKARKITYLDPASGRRFEFISNNMKMNPLCIAGIYKKRWQIELLFKRIKQSYPLKYFLGDSENAIKIQIWCSLITDLLVKIVKDKVKRKWSYANIASMIRLHLMSYVDIFKFLNNPEKALLNYTPPTKSLQLGLYT